MRLGVWAVRRCTFFDSELFLDEQYTTIDQWQDVLTHMALSAACKITATFQVDKDLQVETPASEYLSTVVYCVMLNK